MIKVNKTANANEHGTFKREGYSGGEPDPQILRKTVGCAKQGVINCGRKKIQLTFAILIIFKNTVW